MDEFVMVQQMYQQMLLSLSTPMPADRYIYIIQFIKSNKWKCCWIVKISDTSLVCLYVSSTIMGTHMLDFTVHFQISRFFFESYKLNSLNIHIWTVWRTLVKYILFLWSEKMREKVVSPRNRLFSTFFLLTYKSDIVKLFSC